jgi:hypothetical protein
VSLSTKLMVSLAAQQDSALDLATASMPLQLDRTIRLSSGTGSGQADRVWADTRTLAASATEDLDLAGVLTDAFGATITFARVKGLIVAASAANTNNVVLGNVTNGVVGWFGAATHTISVRPGGLLVLAAPDATAYAITAGTADLLHVANSSSGTSVSYDIAIIGASA